MQTIMVTWIALFFRAGEIRLLEWSAKAVLASVDGKNPLSLFILRLEVEE